MRGVARRGAVRCGLQRDARQLLLTVARARARRFPPHWPCCAARLRPARAPRCLVRSGDDAPRPKAVRSAGRAIGGSACLEWTAWRGGRISATADHHWTGVILVPAGPALLAARPGDGGGQRPAPPRAPPTSGARVAAPTLASVQTFSVRTSAFDVVLGAKAWRARRLSGRALISSFIINTRVPRRRGVRYVAPVFPRAPREPIHGWRGGTVRSGAWRGEAWRARGRSPSENDAMTSTAVRPSFEGVPGGVPLRAPRPTGASPVLVPARAGQGAGRQCRDRATRRPTSHLAREGLWVNASILTDG